MSRGRVWLEALTGAEGRQWQTASVTYADANWEMGTVRAICVTPNCHARFPRARQGQFGIEEGWALASCIRDAMEGDAGRRPRAILAVVDVPGQAFGLCEETLALHQSLAASVDAYASARASGHPIIALVVGKAISGAFLAHGLQAGYLFALDDAEVEIHVMSAASVARVTRRTREEVTELEEQIPAIARDVRSFASLGAVEKLLSCNSADSPDEETVERVRGELQEAFRELSQNPREPKDRLDSAGARESRAMSLLIRERLEAAWG
jgi:malonate decarboxylase beta subunit